MIHSFFTVVTRHWVSMLGALVAIVALVLMVMMVVGSSRVDLQACKLEYSIVSPK